MLSGLEKYTYSNTQGRGGRFGNGCRLSNAVFGDDHDLAVLDLADELRADDVERAGLRGEDRRAVEIAEHKRANPQGVPRADQLLVGQRHERERALDGAQGVDELVDEARLPALRHQMQDHFRVRGRLADRPALHQLLSKRERVGQVAVVAHGEAPGGKIREQGLNVAQNGVAGGRVANVADCAMALEPVHRAAFGKVISDQAEAAFGIEPLAVEGNDTGRFLPAMLQGVEAQRRERGRVLMPKNAEYTALFPQLVVVVQFERNVRTGYRVTMRHGASPSPQRPTPEGEGRDAIQFWLLCVLSSNWLRPLRWLPL